mmetsp:Transcript_70952/g.112762  ORF Transcript_70952/g.112762 Transcript_70952/m.112762 type:complete len:392 (-) Transcript_70952:442-1617(-)
MAQTVLYQNANFVNNSNPEEQHQRHNPNSNSNASNVANNIESNFAFPSNESNAVKNEQNKTKILVSYHDEAHSIFGCKHYARNCLLRAACCNQWYVCRFCHDEKNEEMEQTIPYYRPHQINRYATKHVKCMQCGTEQLASQYCSHCTVPLHDTHDHAHCHDIDNDSEMNEALHTGIKEEKQERAKEEVDDDAPPADADAVQLVKAERARYAFGAYYCDICKFYDNAVNKEIFHCSECGLCRLGQRKDYVHCPRCGCCLHYKYYAKHPCIENSLKSDCPICFTYLFRSREPVTFFMPCGHPIHYDCLMQYAKVGNWKCPICRAAWCDVSNEEQATQTLPPHRISKIDGNGAIVIVDNPAPDSNHNHHHHHHHADQGDDNDETQSVQPMNEPQ